MCKRINECAVSFNQTNCGKINSAKLKLVHEWDEYVNMFKYSVKRHILHAHHIYTHIYSKNSLKFQLIIFWMIKWKIVCFFFVGYCCCCCCMWVCILFQLQRITLCISSLQFNFTFHDLVLSVSLQYPIANMNIFRIDWTETKMKSNKKNTYSRIEYEIRNEFMLWIENKAIFGIIDWIQ